MCAQLCLTLRNPTRCSLPGFSVHGIFQARILEWAAIPYPGDLLDPGIKPVPPAFPALAGGFFTTEPPGKPCSFHTTYHITVIYPLDCSSLFFFLLISLFVSFTTDELPGRGG